MKKIIRTVLVWLLAVGLFCSGPCALAAEGDTAEENTFETQISSAPEAAAPSSPAGAQALPEAVSVIDYVLSSSPETSGQPERERPSLPETDYRKVFRFSEDTLIRGVFEKKSLYVRTNDYWEIGYAYAQIEYTVSPLIRGDVPASLTFFINDRPIYSCAVDYQNGASQVTYVSIPVSLLQEGYNEFAVSGFVRLYDEEGCLDDFSGANWISISASSFLEIGYDLIDTAHHLCYYPYPLLSTADENGEELIVYVPAEASEEELRAAFLLRADLGNETDSEDHIEFRTLDRYGESWKNAAIVAAWDRLPAWLRDGLPGEWEEKAGEGALVFADGRLEVDADGDGVWDAPDDVYVELLVITAKNEADLVEGAYMLLDEDRVTQEKESWTVVPSGAAEKVIREKTISSLILNGDTIKGITNQNGIDFIGPFHQEAVIYLPFSGGFVLGEGGKVDLRLRYSDNLDFDRAMITVYWGETPVASKKLEQDKAGGDNLTFLMPPDVSGTHASSIKIAYDLEVKELYCTKRIDEMPWGYVSGDSTLFLPAGNSSTFDLALRPYPFQELGLLNDLALVVPDEMSSAEYALFGRIAALLGTNLSPYGEMRVWRASSYPAETQNSHVVTLGTWKSNAFLRLLNDRLSFRYEEGGNAFASNEQLLLSERYAREIGILQIIRSPWQEGRAILAVSGVGDGALENIDRFCSVQENNWTLGGDAFLIDNDLETKSYRFLEELVLRKPGLRERLEEHKDAILLTLISSSAMLILLVAVVLALIRYRRNKREEEKKQ